MYQKKAKGWTKHADFMVWDMVALQIAFVFSYIVRHGFVNPYAMLIYRDMAIFLGIVDVLVLILFETLKNVLKRGYYKEFAITVKHVLIVELAASMYLFSGKTGQEYSRMTFYLTGLFYGILTYGMRLVWKRYLMKKMSKAALRSLLIVTTAEKASEVVEHVRKNNFVGFRLVGLALVDGAENGEKQIEGVPVVATLENLTTYVCREWVDEVLIKLPGNEQLGEEVEHELSQAGVTIHFALGRTDKMHGERRIVESVAGYMVLTRSINYATTMQLFLKRSMDIVGGLVGCVMTGIIFLFVAPIIKVQSPGPIFFSQERVGKNGKRFRIYKFRSMYPDAEERKKELLEQNKMSDGMMFKLDFDPRVIGNKILPDGSYKRGVGHFLRVSSLDEFPQFLNVLKGEMSLVGTRPPTVDEWIKYELHHRARMAIKPGITGLWQVSGRSNITDFEEVVDLDTKYIMEWSMGMDLRILLKTVKTVLGKDGSV
ncbi:MAG: sugar transferase [Lachnospiraceae bacterium]|nr:sugar transferase [Lachnospiraceae bacterium]